MTHAKYSSEVLVKGGRICKATVVGLDQARSDQKTAIATIKPLMNAWIRKQITKDTHAVLLVKTKYAETATSLVVEFKIQSVTHDA